MSDWIDIQLALRAYEGASKVLIDGQCQNLYLEKHPEGSKSQVPLIGTPGLSVWTTVGNGPVRGMLQMGAYLYVVSGQELYRVDSRKNAVLIGEVKGFSNVSMIENGTDVLITTGGRSYAARADQILELPEFDLIGAAYQDGYGIAAKKGTEQFYLSGLDDLTSWSAIDFSSADTFSDNLVGLVSDHRELWLFGERSTEVWHNVGTAFFPFQRAGSGFMERGCMAPGSITKAMNRVFWLGNDYQVYMATGYDPKPVAQPGIVRLIEAAASPATAESFTYTQEGHTFYVLIFSDLTVAYDLTTGLWHTRKSAGMSRWRANCYANPWRLQLVGDYSNGNIYEMDMDAYSENGADLVRRMAAAPLNPGSGSRGVMDEFYLDMETGVGLTTGQGSNPQAMLDFSDDGGKTWSNEHWTTIGAIGKYEARVRWQRLGAFRQRTVRITISDPVKCVVVKAKARVERLET